MKMNFDKHYEERTPDIRLDAFIPYANSLPISKVFLGKKFQKHIKNLPILYGCGV